MPHPTAITELDIMTALCCGDFCQAERGETLTGVCHRWDFRHEAARVQRLLQMAKSESPTLIILERDNDTVD